LSLIRRSSNSMQLCIKYVPLPSSSYPNLSKICLKYPKLLVQFHHAWFERCDIGLLDFSSWLNLFFFANSLTLEHLFGFEKTHFLKSVFYRSRWKNKTPAVPDSYKRCTLLLELKTCCANLKPFTITLRLLGPSPNILVESEFSNIQNCFFCQICTLNSP
jgi:hypothetical protein